MLIAESMKLADQVIGAVQGYVARVAANLSEQMNALRVRLDALPPLEQMKGADGAPGPMGERGADGLAGKDGMPGERGPAGPAGEKGPSGERGEKGDTGAPGERGADGAPGEVGPQGPAGAAPNAVVAIFGAGTQNLFTGNGYVLEATDAGTVQFRSTVNALFDVGVTFRCGRDAACFIWPVACRIWGRRPRACFSATVT